MIDFKDLLDFCRAESLGNLMEPTEASVWRSICREYSTKFHTQLDIVMEKLDPYKVILNVYESQLDNFDLDENLEQILDIAYSLSDPNYSKEKAEEQRRFDEQAEEEEKERLESGESLFKYLARKSVKNKGKKKKQALSDKDAPTLKTNPKKMPKSGGLDMAKLQHLADEEKDGSGFDEED
jgi:hypothetical protein